MNWYAFFGPRMMFLGIGIVLGNTSGNNKYAHAIGVFLMFSGMAIEQTGRTKEHERNRNR